MALVAEAQSIESCWKSLRRLPEMVYSSLLGYWTMNNSLITSLRLVPRDLQDVVDRSPRGRRGGRRVAEPQQGLRVPVDAQLVA